MLAELAAARVADPDLPLVGAHVFALGGLTAAATWRGESLREAIGTDAAEPAGLV